MKIREARCEHKTLSMTVEMGDRQNNWYCVEFKKGVVYSYRCVGTYKSCVDSEIEQIKIKTEALVSQGMKMCELMGSVV